MIALAAAAWLAAWLAAWRTARAVTPEPWAWRATALCALSPAPLWAPPEAAAAAALLAVGAMLVLDGRALGAAFAAGAPWLFAPAWGAALVIGLVAVRRAPGRMGKLLALEAVLLSVSVWVAVFDAKHGRPAPPDVRLGLGVPEAWWAVPAALLAAAGVAQLVRRRRRRLTEVLPEHAEAERAAGPLLAAAVATVLAVAVLEGGTVAPALPLLAAPAALGLRLLARR